MIIPKKMAYRGGLYWLLRGGGNPHPSPMEPRRGLKDGHARDLKRNTPGGLKNVIEDAMV